jgi:hypothetical protein
MPVSILGEHLDGGGLAGAVGPDAADHLAGLNLEREPIDHDHRPALTRQQGPHRSERTAMVHPDVKDLA